MRPNLADRLCSSPACSVHGKPTDDTPDASVFDPDTDPLSGLPSGSDQWTALCAKHYGDMISARSARARRRHR